MDENSTGLSEERQWQIDARSFASAAVQNWNTWLGALGGLGFMFVLSMLKQDVPLWLVPWLIAFGLVWGSFDAWRSERRAKELAIGNNEKLMALRNDLIDQKRANCPSIKCGFLLLSSGTTERSRGNITQQCSYLFVTIDIRNFGTPSIVEGFRLRIKNERIDITVIPTIMTAPFEGTAKGLSAGESVVVTFLPEDQIIPKADVPISEGAIIRGTILFLLPEVNIFGPDFRDPETILALECMDVTGKRYLFQTKFHGGGGENHGGFADSPIHFSGLRGPTVTPSLVPDTSASPIEPTS